MKKFQYLFILLLCGMFACSEADTDPVPTEFSGLWSGEMSCGPIPIFLNIRLNIQANQTRCDACYTVGFFMEGPEEGLQATEVNGELVLDRYIINEGGSEGAVSIDGRCRLTSDGKLVFDFEMEEMSGDNFSYTCTSTLTSQ